MGTSSQVGVDSLTDENTKKGGKRANYEARAIITVTAPAKVARERNHVEASREFLSWRVRLTNEKRPALAEPVLPATQLS